MDLLAKENEKGVQLDYCTPVAPKSYPIAQGKMLPVVTTGSPWMLILVAADRSNAIHEPLLT